MCLLPSETGYFRLLSLALELHELDYETLVRQPPEWLDDLVEMKRATQAAASTPKTSFTLPDGTVIGG
jgi:hypothetical protein